MPYDREPDPPLPYLLNNWLDDLAECNIDLKEYAKRTAMPQVDFLDTHWTMGFFDSLENQRYLMDLVLNNEVSDSLQWLWYRIIDGNIQFAVRWRYFRPKRTADYIKSVP